MTSSRSKVSRSNLRILTILVTIVALTGLASAGRKRVVVLELEGPKAEKFQADLVKIIKKSHTVVSADKWSDKGGDASPSKDNLKKTAKKLKVDGVVTGVVEKRRGEYILRVKLHAGASGKVVGKQVFKAEGAKIDSDLARDVKSELVELIGGLDSVRGGGDEDEDEDEEKPRKGKKPVDDEEDEEEKPKKSGFSKKAKGNEDDEKPKKTAKKGKPADDDEDEPKGDDDEGTEEDPLPKAKKRPASSDDDEEDDVASGGDDDDGGEVSEEAEPGEKMDAARALSPGERAVDLAVGFSFSARRMGFVYSSDLVQTSRPPRYRGTPVPGFLLDTTIYPLAFGHKRDGMAKNFGLTVLFDRVLLVSSQAPDGTKLNSAQQRYALGAAFRYPFNKTAMSPVVGATLRYGRQKFTIDGDAGIPNVNYTIIDPSLFFKYPVSSKLVLGVNLGYMAVTNTGAIQKMEQYGGATVSGFEGELGGDYMITKNVFLRAAFKFQTIGFDFSGNGMKTNVDADAEPDVFGARDTYLGGMITAGYAL